MPTSAVRIIEVIRPGIQGRPGPQASSNRIIVSATPPTTREDGTALQPNDIWIKAT